MRHHTSTPHALRLGNVLVLDVTGGGEVSLAIYSAQDDIIYLDCKPACLDQDS